MFGVTNGEYVKGNIMLRIHLDNKATTAGSCKQLENYRVGFCLHLQTSLVVRSTPQGYYVEDKMFLISEWTEKNHVFVRDDMPAICGVSLQELTDDRDVLALGCGTFTCEYGDVKISMLSGRTGLLVDIVSSTVIRFNATVEALRNGELKPVGDEQTVLEKLREKIDGLQWKVEMFNHQITAAVDLLNKKEHEIHLLKTRGWWRRLWNLPPALVKVNKGCTLDDCLL